MGLIALMLEGAAGKSLNYTWAQLAVSGIADQLLAKGLIEQPASPDSIIELTALGRQQVEELKNLADFFD